MVVTMKFEDLALDRGIGGGGLGGCSDRENTQPSG